MRVYLDTDVYIAGRFSLQLTRVPNWRATTVQTSVEGCQISTPAPGNLRAALRQSPFVPPDRAAGSKVAKLTHTHVATFA
jgi:hypothetical protein